MYCSQNLGILQEGNYRYPNNPPTLDQLIDKVEARRLQVTDIDFDFQPAMHESSKSLWIQLRFPPPRHTVTAGKRVRLDSVDPNLVFPAGEFVVIDIIGTRVILKPLGSWKPEQHAGHWGHSTKDWEYVSQKPIKDWTYGYGLPLAYLRVMN